MYYFFIIITCLIDGLYFLFVDFIAMPQGRRSIHRKASDFQPRSDQTNISCQKFYPLNRFILHENSPARRKNTGLSEYSTTLHYEIIILH